MLEWVVKFTATIDKVTYVTDGRDNIDISSFHISSSDIGLEGTFEQFTYSNNIIIDPWEAFITAAPPLTDFEPFDVVITLMPNDGNPYVYNDNIVLVEVI